MSSGPLGVLRSPNAVMGGREPSWCTLATGAGPPHRVTSPPGPVVKATFARLHAAAWLLAAVVVALVVGLLIASAM
ncbi:MAG: hypothetical protein JWP64_4793 [Pseudonocardia sp.]|jgi:hypothetical protein|nr:hypothetical protein [Pseudonocardia sp.]MDT7701086.1 hypothetical protein [Pseudonocardiales bacterium]